jgi:hypothetical protein
MHGMMRQVRFVGQIRVRLEAVEYIHHTATVFSWMRSIIHNGMTTQTFVPSDWLSSFYFF